MTSVPAHALAALLAAAAPAAAADWMTATDAARIGACLAGAGHDGGNGRCLGTVTGHCLEQDGGGIQGEAICPWREAEAWEAIMRRTAARIAAAGDAAGAAALADAQDAWVAFREADCDLPAARWRHGSGVQVEMSRCRRDRTAERAMHLIHFETID